MNMSGPKPHRLRPLTVSGKIACEVLALPNVQRMPLTNTCWEYPYASKDVYPANCIPIAIVAVHVKGVREPMHGLWETNL